MNYAPPHPIPEVDRWLAELIEALPTGEVIDRLMHLQTLIMRERIAHAGQLTPAVIDGEFEEAAPGPPRAQLSEQRFQLTGDARLQFWREAYLGAQASLIRGAPYLPAMTSPRDVGRMATEMADYALAMHLLRNDVKWPDSCVDLYRQWEKQLSGG